MTMHTIATPAPSVHVSTLDELRHKGVVVVRGGDRPIAVFYNDGRPMAVDNRCPHMGFPMHKGSVKDGIVTCHWHEARFDLCSGCTFDLFADDLPSYDCAVRDDAVYVARVPKLAATADYYAARLERGMHQNISLIQGKGLIGLLKSGKGLGDLVCQIAQFGSVNHDQWQAGMTSLAAVVNLHFYLDEETAYFALFKAVSRVATDCNGAAPRRLRHELETDAHDLVTLKRWLRHWSLVRHRDGAERTFLTAITGHSTAAELNDLVVAAVTDRPYANTGHTLDFVNKAFELMDVIGEDQAADLFPLILAGLVSARGGEESSAWRYPIDLIPPLHQAEEKLPKLMQEGCGKKWLPTLVLDDVLLGEDPIAIIDALGDALSLGASAHELMKLICHAAAMRLARFSLANDVRDWFGPVHTFTHCNAVYQVVRRSDSPDVVRAVFHAAIAVYMDRFLNVPPASLPGERSVLPKTTADGPLLLKQLLDGLDQRHEVDAAATIVAQYFKAGYPVKPLINTLVFAVVREDVDFHALQVIEAAVRQYELWGATEQGEHILIAATRYLAAHCPTQRAGLQTARIALRLHRGDKIYEEDM